MNIIRLLAQLILLVAIAATAAAFQQQQPLPSHPARPLQVVKPAVLSLNGRYTPSLITLATATLASSIDLQSQAPRCPFSFAHVQAKFSHDVKVSNAIPNRSTNGALVQFLQTIFFNLKRRITKPIIFSLYVYWNLKLRGQVPSKIANIAGKINVDEESAEYIDTMYRLLRNKRRFLFVGGNHETTIGEKLHYVSRVLAQEFSTLQTHMMVPTTHPEFSQDYQDVTNRFWEHKNGMTYEDFLLEPQTALQSLGAVHDLVSQFQINVAAAMSNQYYVPQQQEGMSENSSDFRSTLVFKKMAAMHSRMGIQRKDFDSLCNAVHVVMHRALEDATSKSIISKERKEELVDFFVKRFGNEFTLAFCVP